ncbi:MAG: substrate-binding domain-containing protein, partial [Bacillota bacterium]
AHRRSTEIVARLTDMGNPPTAVFCFDYHTTLLLIQSLMKMGITPGKQASVIGFDAPKAACALQVTSINQPALEMGTIAANLLLERIVDPTLKPRTVRLSAQLEVGDTTGPPLTQG